jgi:Immunity protein 40
MKISNDYQVLLSKRGIVLSDLGLSDIALRRADALQAIELLQKESIPVLGGDVYFRQNLKNSLAYANWYCEPNIDEDPQAFSSRSCAKATEYISQFPDLPEKESIFVLVIMK